MKIKASIVNTNYKLIGFIMSGKEKEFGGISNNEIERALQISELSKNNFSNSQIEITAQAIKEKNNFKINSLPMMIYDGSGMMEVDNTVNLTGRILVEGKLRGFEVTFANGAQVNLVYPDVVKLSNWFKPGNFVLRTQESGKTIIAGKPGFLRLEELPEKIFGQPVETGKRKRTSGGGAKTEDVKGKNISPNGNLLELFEIIREGEGIVVYLPGDEYKRTTKEVEKVGEGFHSLGVGEMGSPYVIFGDKKLNSTINFKKVGTVTINFGGMPSPVYTFTYSSKVIFENGKNHVKRFGVGVNKETVGRLVEKFGRELIVREITDRKIVEPIAALAGRSDYVYFEVDTSKMEVMSKESATKSLLSNAELKESAEKTLMLKVHQRFINDAIKNYAKNAPNKSETGTDKPLFGLYAGANPEYIKAVAEAGIDVFSGAFIKREKVAGAANEENEEDTTNTRGSSASIEIEYAIAGKMTVSGISYKSVVDAVNGKGEIPKLCDKQLLQLAKKLESLKSPANQLKKAEEYKENLDKMLFEERRRNWFHKVAMLTLGDGNGKLYSTNKAWTEKKSNSKSGIQYECTEAGCEGLVMKVTNATL